MCKRLFRRDNRVTPAPFDAPAAFCLPEDS